MVRVDPTVNVLVVRVDAVRVDPTVNVFATRVDPVRVDVFTRTLDKE